MDKFKNIKKKLHGPIFSILTPFKKNEEIDFYNLKKYINFLYDRGAKVFYLMVYNSRLGLLSEKEIIKLNNFCIKEVKRLSKKNIIICAEPYHTSTQRSIELCNYFHKKGADIVSVIFGEKYYSDDQVFQHFKRINKKVKKFLLLHQQPLENGISSNPIVVNYSINLTEKIVNLKNFIAIKEDTKNDNFTKKICKKLSNKIVIITSGNGKKQWLKATKFGCQSWLSGVSNLNPEIAFDFYKAYQENNMLLIKNILKYVEDPFFKVSKKFGWHVTIKAFLQLSKIFFQHERQPLVKLDIKKVKKTYNEMKSNQKKYFKKKYFHH